MFFTEHLEVECPCCRKKQDITIHHVIDLSAGDQLKEALLTGQINTFACAGCGFEGYISVPLFCHDKKKRIGAFLAPPEILDDPAHLKKSFTKKGTISPAGSFADYGRMPVHHVVFSMEELIRYIIFRDRLIEAHHTGDAEDGSQ
jgi:hypothetical protein